MCLLKKEKMPKNNTIIPFSLDFFKIGYVIAFKMGEKDKYFGKLIYKEQKKHGFDDESAEYTHVGISSGDEHYVNIAPPESRLVNILEYHKGRYIKIIKPKVYNDDLTERKRLKVALIYNAEAANRKYDVFGIIKFKIPFMFHKEKEFFCSEGCAYAIQHQFPDYLNGLPPYQTMPANFLNKKEHDLVWEGFIPNDK